LFNKILKECYLNHACLKGKIFFSEE